MDNFELTHDVVRKIDPIATGIDPFHPEKFEGTLTIRYTSPGKPPSTDVLRWAIDQLTQLNKQE